MSSNPIPLVVIAAVAAASLAACSSSGPPLQSVQASAVAPAPSPSVTQPGRPDAVWTTDIGSESWSQPAALGDLVVVGANDGVLRGLESATGEVAWELPTGGALRGGILAVDDIAYVVSDDGLLYAVDAQGNPLWTAPVGAPVESRSDYDNYGSRPAHADGVVYAATYSGDVAAINAETGDTLWSVNVGSPVEAGLALGDGRLHVSSMAGFHYALSIVDGSIVWELPTVFAMTTTPAVMGDKVIVGSRSANVQVRDEATGEKVWTVSLGSSWVQSGAVPINDDTFAIGSSDYKAVRGFEIETGVGTWLTQVGGWTWAVPATADGVVYASEIRLDYQLPWDTALWALDGETGEVLWTSESGPALEWAPDGYGAYGNGAGPVIAGDLVVIPGLDGVVRAFER